MNLVFHIFESGSKIELTVLITYFRFSKADYVTEKRISEYFFQSILHDKFPCGGNQNARNIPRIFDRTMTDCFYKSKRRAKDRKHDVRGERHKNSACLLKFLG